MKSSTPGKRRNVIRRYLEYRERDLSLLEKDLNCRPFSTETTSPELVIAVDWSEVHAYIFSEEPAEDEPTFDLLEADTAQAVHQIGLVTLFERFPGQILLIPPYAQEMARFVDQIKSIANGLPLLDQRHGELYLDLMQNMKSSTGLSDMSSIVNQLRPNGKVPSFSEFKEKMDALDRSQVVAWVQERFSGFLMIAKLLSVDALGSLSFLLNRSGPGDPRTAFLADKYLDIARSFVDEPPLENWWKAELKAAGGAKKQGDPLALDVQALAYLERLNHLLHAQNKQLIFVTRGKDLRRVANNHPGRFGCLTSAYYNPDAPSELTSGPPTIIRSWRIFFELSMALQENPPHPASPLSDRPNIRDFVRRQLYDVQSRRKRLAERGDREVYNRIIGDFERAIQNECALISVERPRLRHLRDGSSSDADLAAMFFVKYVTDPEAFQVERENIRQSVLREVTAIQDVMTFQQPPGFEDPWEANDYRSITRMFITKVENSDLVADVVESALRESISEVLDFIRDRHDMKALEKPITMAQGIPIDPLAFDERQKDAATLKAAIAYAVGHVDGLRFFLHEYEPLFIAFPELSPQRTLYHLLLADVAARKRDTFAANTVLRRAWYKATQFLGQRNGLPSDTIQLSCYAGLVDAWLRFHLEMTEEWEERLDNFPLSAADNRFELEDILESAQDLRGHRSLGRVSERLQHSLTNNFLYGSTRVTPSIEFQGVGSTARVGDQKVGDLLTKNLWSNRTLQAVSELATKPLQSAEEHDTLAYFYIKHAYWNTLVERYPRLISQWNHPQKAIGLGSQEALRLADEHLEIAKSSNRRTKILVSSHRKLFVHVRHLLKQHPKGG